MKRLLLPFFIAVCSIGYIDTAAAQTNKSHTIKPRWIHKLPKPSNNSFNYELDLSMASSLDEAREKSLAGLIANSGFENGVVVISDYESKIIDSQTIENGEIKERMS